MADDGIEGSQQAARRRQRCTRLVHVAAPLSLLPLPSPPLPPLRRCGATACLRQGSKVGAPFKGAEGGRRGCLLLAARPPGDMELRQAVHWAHCCSVPCGMPAFYTFYNQSCLPVRYSRRCCSSQAMPLTTSGCRSRDTPPAPPLPRAAASAADACSARCRRPDSRTQPTTAPLDGSTWGQAWEAGACQASAAAAPAPQQGSRGLTCGSGSSSRAGRKACGSGSSSRAGRQGGSRRMAAAGQRRKPPARCSLSARRCPTPARPPTPAR